MTALAHPWARWSGWYWYLAAISAWLFKLVVNMALTPKQEVFCRECFIDLSATQPAIRAGYNEKTANEQGTRLLANVSISQRISELKVERNTQAKINADYEFNQVNSF